MPEIVSDIVVGDLIEKHISNKNFKNRLIFVCYPRNLPQARNLELFCLNTIKK